MLASSDPLSFDGPSFDGLWEALLQGGVARRPARRYLAELREHLDDLIAEERQAAADERDARVRALARLGSVDELAGAMSARREFRTWSAKAPVATWLIAPSLALAAGAALAMVGLVATATSLKHATGAPADLPAWMHGLAAGAVVFSNTLLPVLLGWALVVMAVRQRSPSRWPILGIVLLAAVGAAAQFNVTLPSATAHGEIGYSADFESLAEWSSYAGRLVLNLALTLFPYVALSLWRTPRVRSA
jgi:hypothetical protein